MVTYRNKGEIVELQLPGSGVTKDVPVQIGQLIVIPTVTLAYAADTRFNGLTCGVVTGLTKKASQAWTEGQVIYWDAEEVELTSTAGDNHEFGRSLEVCASGAQEVTAGEVLFNGMLSAADETT